MATGRKWCSWWKSSKLDFYQISLHPTPPDSTQSHSDNPRNLPDTFQTPYRHPKYRIFRPIRGNWEKRNKLIEITLARCLSIAFTSYPPESIQSHQDNTKTPLRHLPDTFQTPQNIAHFDQSEATGKNRNMLMKMSRIGCLFVSCTSYPPDSI